MTETIPTPALISVSSGEEHALLYPEQVKDFLTQHWDCRFVSHNVAFDYWVVAACLALDLSLIQTLVDENRWHDSMLLDQLIRLAKTGGNDEAFFSGRSLDKIALDYAGLKISKEDPYRMRYGEIIGKRFDEIEEGFLDYAILDSVVLHRAFLPMFREAVWLQSQQMPETTSKTFEVFPNAIRKYGVLTEGIQVKAAVTLADVTRKGLAVSQETLSVLEMRLRTDLDSKVEWIRGNYPNLLRYYKTKKRAGELMVNKGTRVPKFQTDALRVILAEVAEQNGFKVPTTPKDGKLSASIKVWQGLAPNHPLIEAWGGMGDTAKLLQFVVQVKGVPVVHPQYRTLVKTGRTSSLKGESPTGLNIQQMPREGWFREVFVARPGYKLAAIDYSYIELRTLASVCLALYGKSRLAEVIKEGTDPHVNTAAMFLDMDLAAFKALKKDDPGRFKESRQAAKAVNFGVPGGLGALKLSVYAKNNYGVSLSQQEAGQFKKVLISEVYPELSIYLEDRSAKDLAMNLRAPTDQVRAVLGIYDKDETIRMGSIKKIVGGRAYKADGTPYNSWYVSEVWRGLERLNQTGDVKIDDAIARREGSPWLEEILFRRTVATLTGRLRAGVKYTEARNTPFQGLAADGAKLALWELHKRDQRIVAFIHDEILIEVPEDRAEEAAQEAADVMCRSMEQVLFPGVPCSCEWAIGNSWTKA